MLFLLNNLRISLTQWTAFHFTRDKTYGDIIRNRAAQITSSMGYI